MSFVTVPTDGLHSVSSSLTYTYTISVSTSITFAPAIKFDIYANSKLQDSVFQNVYISKVLNGANNNYTFEIDIAPILSRFFDNDTPFNPSSILFTDDNLQCSFYVVATEYNPNSSGILTAGGITTSITRSYAINSRVTDLSDYIYDSNTVKFLTNSPIKRTIKESVPYYLAIFSNSDITHIQVSLYDAVGTRLDGSYFALTQNKVNILNVGTDEIDNFTYAASITYSSSVAYYTIEAGIEVTGAFQSRGELRYFYVDRSNSCESVTFNFQNRFGAVDTFIFEKFNYNRSISSNNYYKQGTGNTKLQGVIQESYVLREISVIQSIYNWLLEIYESVYAQIEHQGITQAVMIQDNSFTVFSLENSRDIIVNVIVSQEQLTHLN